MVRVAVVPTTEDFQRRSLDLLAQSLSTRKEMSTYAFNIPDTDRLVVRCRRQELAVWRPRNIRYALRMPNHRYDVVSRVGIPQLDCFI